VQTAKESLDLYLPKIMGRHSGKKGCRRGGWSAQWSMIMLDIEPCTTSLMGFSAHGHLLVYSVVDLWPFSSLDFLAIASFSCGPCSHCMVDFMLLLAVLFVLHDLYTL
jgi:hypothetical protein